MIDDPKNLYFTHDIQRLYIFKIFKSLIRYSRWSSFCVNNFLGNQIIILYCP